MSSSIFCSALSRAINRRPLSPLALARLNSTLSNVKDKSSEAPPHAPPDDEHKLPFVARPSPLTVRHGRKIPKLFMTLRDLSLARDVPRNNRKRNLSHQNPRNMVKRSVRRYQDKLWKERHGKRDVKGALKAKYGEDKINYLEQLRQHRLTLALLQHDQNYKITHKFKKRERRDEPQSLSSITRELIEACAWFANVTFSPLPNHKKGLRITHGLDPDIVTITKTFNYKNRSFLRSKGYNPADVVAWAWILASKDAEQAGWRMKVYQEGLPLKEDKEHEDVPKLEAAKVRNVLNWSDSTSHDVNSSLWGSSTSPSIPKPYPAFVIMHTIRRKPLSRTTISYVLSIGSQFLASLSTDSKTKVLFFIRMLRRIREEYILALPYLAQLITTHLNFPPNPSENSVEHLTFVYNKLLTLMARPPQEEPFMAQPVIEQSHFMLIRKMSSMNILVTREGYRAIISTQLAHAKTPEERERIKGMRKGWPPWQEERDAWSDKNERGKITRAGVVLRQMKDAGYPHKAWEQAASVLAGEDTDETPTIPTRTYLPLPPSEARLKAKQLEKERREQVRLERLEKEKTRVQDEEEAILWQARIRATRTVEEAWSIFLEARDSLAAPTTRMYYELFEKLVFHERLQRETKIEKNRNSIEVLGGGNAEKAGSDNAPPAVLQQEDIDDESTINILMSMPAHLTPEQRNAILQNHANQLRLKKLQGEKYANDKPVPGEGKEVIPAPFSPSEGGVHVPVPPPSIGSLYQTMLRDNVQPTQNLLILLVKEAQNMDTAEWLIGEDLVRGFWEATAEAEKQGLASTSKSRVRWKLLWAYLNALINCGQVERAVRLLITTSVNSSKEQAKGYLPAWKVVIKGLVDWNGFAPDAVASSHSKGVVHSDELKKRKTRLVLAWKLYRHMRDLKIAPDGGMLKSLCVAAQRAIYLEREIAEGKMGSRQHCHSCEGDAILWDGKRPWEQVVKEFRLLIGNLQTPEEMEAEIDNLASLTNEEFSKPGAEESPTTPKQTVTVGIREEMERFWATFEELEPLSSSPSSEGEDRSIPSIPPHLLPLESSIDPLYYTPRPLSPQPSPSPPQSPSSSSHHHHHPTQSNQTSLHPTACLPPLYVPQFSTLHAYIRMLGLSHQHREITHTLAWMRRVEEYSLQNSPSGPNSGVAAVTPLSMKIGVVPEGERRRGRKLIIAAGCFLEGSTWEGMAKVLLGVRKRRDAGCWGKEGDGEEEDEEEDEEEEEGEKKVWWGGWPMKEEIDEYRAISDRDLGLEEGSKKGEKEGDDPERDVSAEQKGDGEGREEEVT